jgi:3-phenylpropionate/trans-cinnamate dioxygenase ferredoxin reductase component
MTSASIGNVPDLAFSVLCFKQGQLIAVESVNRAGDHVAARRLLAGKPTLTPQQAAVPGFELKAFVGAARA